MIPRWRSWPGSIHRIATSVFGLLEGGLLRESEREDEEKDVGGRNCFREVRPLKRPRNRVWLDRKDNNSENKGE